MDYVLHRCDPAGFDCTGGGNNPHVCEVDSVHQGACSTCSQYPTDPSLLRKVMHNHHLYQIGQGDLQDESAYYRDKLRNPEPEVVTPELTGCQCPSQYLFNFGHKAECKSK